ncbi:MAG TPA: FkbM family methyltransferase [Xanthobacteraceae bacterium]|nr:FkbM family methyltransferase [Xanthobacteraceae bacterium]
MPGTRARSALNRPPLFVSYAGNLEDVILNRVFPQQTGFFVDIGANDPVFGSNTWALYQRGWRGIAIEPSPRVYAKFKAKRPQDICLNVAVGDVEGEISFFQFGDGAGHSTCDRKRAEALRLELGQEMTEFKVPVRTLGNILAEHAQGLDIDVVCIDAEGAEAAILLGAQLDRFRPKLIVIEAMAAFTQVDESQEATRILEQNGYKLGYEDGLNKFFAVKEDAALLEALRYPPSVFDHYITVGELSLRHKSRRRLRLLQLALVGWALSIVLILIAVLLVF